MSNKNQDTQNTRVFVLIYKNKYGEAESRALEKGLLYPPIRHKVKLEGYTPYKIRVGEIDLLDHSDNDKSCLRQVILTHPPDKEPTDDTETAEEFLTSVSSDPKRAIGLYKHFCEWGDVLLKGGDPNLILKISLVDGSDPRGAGTHLYIPEDSKTKLQ